MDPSVTMEDTSTSHTFTFFRFTFVPFHVLSGELSYPLFLLTNCKPKEPSPTLPTHTPFLSLE